MSAILDALSYLGDSLDKPGRAVRGLLAGKAEEGLAAVPFSDTIGLTDQGNRTSGSDLLKSLGVDAGDGLGGTLAGIGAEIATDPLTWLGAGLGARLGSKASAAAVARGPNYATTADDLLRQVPALAHPWEQDAALMHLDALRAVAPRVFSEVPEGSKLLGVGAEGLAARSPDGMVTRLGLTGANLPGRPTASRMLQPVRTADYANGSNAVARAERLPFAEAVGDRAYWDGFARNGKQDRLSQLYDDAGFQGMDFMDMKAANAGRHNGRDVVIDPGAVLLDEYRGGFNPVAQAREAGPLMSRLLDALGSDAAVRAGLTPAYTGRLAAAGGGLGALAGTSSRL